MWLTFPFEVEIYDYTFLFEVECFGSRGWPAKIHGPADYCDPGEDDCLEDFECTLKKVYPKQDFTKIVLSELEFQWWFGSEVVTKLYNQAYKSWSNLEEKMREL